MAGVLSVANEHRAEPGTDQDADQSNACSRE
jgi:hypothetical protein